MGKIATEGKKSLVTKDAGLKETGGQRTGRTKKKDLKGKTEWKIIGAGVCVPVWGLVCGGYILYVWMQSLNSPHIIRA